MSTIDILNQSIVDGKSLRLPEIKLDRKEYCELEKTILKAGGKKVRGKDFRFDFPTDAQPIIEQLCGGEKIDIKKEFQFFETPTEIVKQMIELADICESDYVLEPSAGQGAIAKLIPSVSRLHCYELNEANNRVLHEMGFCVMGFDFLKSEENPYYTKIIANPPFSKNQDIDHVLKMYKVLHVGGRIVTIMSNHWRISSNRKELEFRNWIETIDYSIRELPKETFKESGTSIAACLIVIQK